jgi:NTP pyrophosphatase (non-canonical NTP hydrolase)
LQINQIQKQVHELAIKKGWYDSQKWYARLLRKIGIRIRVKRSIPELLSLIHCELSEGLQEYRKDNMKKFKEEIADVVIRILDMCGELKIDLQQEILKKHNFNKTRPYRHGNKKC